MSKSHHLTRKRMCSQLVVVALLVGVSCLTYFCFEADSLVEDAVVHSASRHLLQSITTPINCTPQAVDQFPTDFFSDYQRRKGAVLLHVFVVIYCFIGLTFVCDEFFTPCLERMCETLNISQDVAGATFMAAGSSAPELATAIFGVFVAKDDIGLSSVVGSAVYNVTFVIAVCCFAVPCGSYLLLNWYSLARDAIYYAICVLLLMWFISDKLIYWYEALILLLLYILYIILMVFNPRLSIWFTEKCCQWLPAHIPQTSGRFGNDTDAIIGHNSYDKLDGNQNGSSVNCESEKVEHTELQPVKSGYWSTQDAENCKTTTESDESSVESKWLLAWPQGTCNTIFHLFLLPLKVLTFLTIPDCRRKPFQRCFFVTFLLSIVWLSFLAYMMMWMVTVIGHTLKIPDNIMGLTFVAAGSCLPNVIATFLVLRKGKSDMAVSNVVGSNVFDILICMGMPWFFMALKIGGPVRVFSRGLFYSTVMLLSTVLLLLMSVHINKWRISSQIGFVLMIFYGFFLCMSVLYELNFFGYMHPPECDTIYY